jgi:hypothetical protein
MSTGGNNMRIFTSSGKGQPCDASDLIRYRRIVRENQAAGDLLKGVSPSVKAGGFGESADVTDHRVSRTAIPTFQAAVPNLS